MARRAPSRESSAATARPKPELAAATMATRSVRPRFIDYPYPKLPCSREIAVRSNERIGEEGIVWDSHGLLLRACRTVRNVEAAPAGTLASGDRRNRDAVGCGAGPCPLGFFVSVHSKELPAGRSPQNALQMKRLAARIAKQPGKVFPASASSCAYRAKVRGVLRLKGRDLETRTPPPCVPSLRNFSMGCTHYDKRLRSRHRWYEVARSFPPGWGFLRRSAQLSAVVTGALPSSAGD